MAEELQVADYRYELPKELIAQQPLADRDAARLLVLDRPSGAIDHQQVRDLPALLRRGDLLILNQSRVVPARLFGFRQATGGQWEGLFLRELFDGVWELLSQTRGYLKPGEVVRIDPPQASEPGGVSPPESLCLEVVGRTPDHHLLARPLPSASPELLLDRFGHVPIPPYIRRGVDEPADRERYQTVFARETGSVAAPTAGLHFTLELIQRLTDAGVEISFVTLHVGLGTFQPLQDEQLRTGQLHEERWQVPAETAEAWKRCRTRGGRVFAVGTTTARTLESAYQGGVVQAGTGLTRLFVHEPYEFKAIDGLLTNFHLPESSLLMLVCALAGRARVLKAYAEAVRLRYRFYSYGDAMLII